MAKIINKKSSVVGKIPAPADLEYGELALNYADGKLFYKASNNSIQSFGGAALSNAVRQQFTATAGQTNFSINYTPGQLDVYLNGVKLVTGSDYTATAGTSFTLTTAATAGDIVDVVAGIIFASSDWTYITNKPTTLSGFGITDAQALSTNLTAISALTGTNGFLRTNGSGTWTVDTSAYITGNQNIVFSGDATGNGTTSVSLTLANSGVAAGTYTKVMVDAKGRVTNGYSLTSADLPTYTGTITSSQVTTALGFTPYNATNPSGYISGNQTITFSGDVTGSGATTVSLTLANSGVTAGTYGSSTAVPVLVVDAKGRVTSVSTQSISGSLTFTGDVTGTGSTGSSTALTLANSGVTAGTYTKTTVDAKGRVTSGTTLSASDIPSLDASKITSGTIDAARLPSYVDDVLEYANLAGFPATGETGKIYLALDTNKAYRWSGSAYVYITSGAVDSVAGKTGVVTLTNADVGLGLVENKSSATIRSEITSANVTTALGFTPYNSTNPSGYQTAGNINAYFGSSTTSGTLDWNDVTNTKPGAYGTLLLGSATNGPGSGNYYHPFNLEYNSKDGTGNVTQMAVAYGIPGNELYMRGRYGGSWTGWTRYLNSSNYNSYSPTLTGGGASGTWGISITGNAATTSQRSFSGDISTGGQGRFTGWYSGNAATGTAVEIGMSSGQGYLNVYNRDTATYGILNIVSSSALMQFNGSTINVSSGSLQQAGNQVLHAGNYSSYALPLSGGTVTGTLGVGGKIQRTATGTGYLDGNYSSVETTATSGAIYSIGGSYVPGTTTLGNMYGIGYGYSGNAMGNPGGVASSRWGMYVASAGTARVFLDSDDGSGYFAGSVYANGIRLNQERANNARIYGATTGVMGLVGVDSGGTFRWQLYGEGSSYGFLTSTWGSWDIKKVADGELDIRVSAADRRVLHAGNYSSYALPLTGGVLSGSVQTVTAASSWGVYSKTSGYSNESGIWFSANVGELLLRKADGSLSTRIAADGSYAYINNNNILHAGNYTSYAPSLSGNYKNISVGGLYSRYNYNESAYITDSTSAYTLSPDFGQTTVAMHNSHGFFGSWATTLTMSGYERYGAYQISGNYNSGTPDLAVRNYTQSTSNWNTWVRLLSSANYSSYALPLSGGTVSGAVTINAGGGYPLSLSSSSRYQLQIRNTAASAQTYGWWLAHDSGGNLVFHADSAGDRASLTNSGTFNATNITSNGNQVLHGGNYSSYALPISGGGLTGATTLTAGHSDTRFQLKYNYNGDVNSIYSGSLLLWVSEPGLSYPYSGIGANIYVSGQYYGRQTTGQPYGVFIRFNTDAGEVQFWNTSGTPGSINGQGTQRAHLTAAGELYLANSAYLALHSSNYSSYALPLSGGTMSGHLQANVGITASAGGGDGYGINLYSGNGYRPTYGLFFGQTSNFGTHGSVTADWATYFTMNSTANRGWVFRLQDIGSNVASINTSGTAVFNGNVTAFSDERLKKDWNSLPHNFIERLAEVKMGTYTRTDEDMRQVGVSAQSLQQLLPEAVLDGEYLSVAYGNAALAATVELAKRVVQQDQKIAELTALVQKLLNKE